MSLFSDIDLSHAISGSFFEPANRLVDYFLESKGKNFDENSYLEFLLARKSWKQIVATGIQLHYTVMEGKIFGARANLLANNNRAYTLATKLNPTAEELAEFSEINTLWCLIFPIKRYLTDHPEIAKYYTGMQPIGDPVKKFFNKVAIEQDESWIIPENSNGNYADHEHLRILTNHHAILNGVPTITINNWMYQEGCKM